ncbi:MAG: NAD-binding protein, partial [Anaerolineae bacterium]|nr:NAD-binding protein [Anaerolineae bacterium]
MEELQRQIRIAMLAAFIIIPAGIIGFMLIEGMPFIDAAYLTIITLSTIGYGDIHATTDAGHIFTVFLVVFGLGAFVYLAQVSITLFASPELRKRNQRIRTRRAVARLEQHYILCGVGEIVDRTIEYLRQDTSISKQTHRDRHYLPLDQRLDHWFGDDDEGHYLWLRRPIRALVHFYTDLFRRQGSVLDTVVVITTDSAYAEALRDTRLLVVEGAPTDDEILLEAGIKRARAIMVMLDSDMETLLTVLTAHNLNPPLRITATALSDELSANLARVGASTVITPYGTAGQFLNNATFRPAVNDFFNGLLFESDTSYSMIQLDIHAESPWCGQSIGSLNLREKYDAAAIGIRYEDARFDYAPEDFHVLQADELLIVVAPSQIRVRLQTASQGSERDGAEHLALWQPLPHRQPQLIKEQQSPDSIQAAIDRMSKHFVICGDDRVARSAIAALDPDRPFVIISNEETFTEELLARGFRVVEGSPTQETTLRRAGVDRAQAIMVALESSADSVLTILNSRRANKRLLITATANTDDMIDKLRRAGADRVLSPFHVAARYTLLTTMYPELAAFLNYVLYNYYTGLETTEIYMEDESVWIGQTI